MIHIQRRARNESVSDLLSVGSFDRRQLQLLSDISGYFSYHSCFTSLPPWTRLTNAPFVRLTRVSLPSPTHLLDQLLQLSGLPVLFSVTPTGHTTSHRWI